VRKAKALQGLSRLDEAREVMEDCLQGNPGSREYQNYLNELSALDDGSWPLLPLFLAHCPRLMTVFLGDLASFYQGLTVGSNVEILEFTRVKGKGTFSKRDFNFGEVVFTEVPLGYFRAVGESVRISGLLP